MKHFYSVFKGDERYTVGENRTQLTWLIIISFTEYKTKQAKGA